MIAIVWLLSLQLVNAIAKLNQKRIILNEEKIIEHPLYYMQ
jgi:hypothetical protein